MINLISKKAFDSLINYYSDTYSNHRFIFRHRFGKT